MKRIDKPNKTTIILLTVTAVLIVALIAFLIISLSLRSNDNSKETQNKDMTISQCTVVTPYCELKYPGRWKDQMEVKELTENDTLSYVFYALVEEKQYELYTVHFGDSEYGDLFGYISFDGEDIPVYIDCHTITDSDALPEAELSQYYSMMEGINDVVQSISSTSGYFKP